MSADHDDFAQEPIRGLPELPPEGEKILWQGAPEWKALAREALNINWVAGYFLAMAAWSGVRAGMEKGWPIGFQAATVFVVMGLIACTILAVIAYVQARTTVYTITNRRIAMRVGAALTVTLNIPFTQILSADLALRKRGSGTIALSLKGDTRLSYLVCWPHVRPWKFAPTQPALRCVANAQSIADLMAEVAAVRLSEKEQERVRGLSGAAQPAE